MSPIQIAKLAALSLGLVTLAHCGGAGGGPGAKGGPTAAHAGVVGATGPVRATESFRKEHVELKEHLAHVNEKVAAMGTLGPEERASTMDFVVKFFRAHIVPHAKWEEDVLYPVVDRHAGSGEHSFTATMRYEHRVVGRWIGELESESKKAAPDAAAFSRRTDQLLGLIWAHFEEEEEVLLPLLDRTMTPEEFQHEVVDKGGHHG